MKNITFIRSNQIHSDSRAEKYLAYYDDNNIDYTIIGWDRNNINAQRKNTIYYRRKTGYVVGGLKAAFNRLYWFCFVLKTLKRLKNKPEFIHACDLDCAFPAVLYKVFCNRNVYVLFDVFDWMSADMQANGNFFIRKSILWMESLCLKHCNKLIVCEDERRTQIPSYEKYDMCILPNIPMIRNEEKVFQKKDDYQFYNGKITLSYVGWLGHGRFLDEMLDLAEKGVFNLLIAGYGNQELVDKCNRLNGNGTVRYYGRVDYMTGLNIQYNADMVYAMYCKVTNNHIFAAPNKYYEAMFLGKPLLTTSGIIIGDKVLKTGIGFTIEETKECFEDLITHINVEDMKEMGIRSRKLWNETYKDYTVNFLKTKYQSMIQ